MPDITHQARLMAMSYPWFTDLPPADREAFMVDLTTVMETVDIEKRNARLGVEIAAWKATAEIHADPELRDALNKGVTGDYGEVRVPDPRVRLVPSAGVEPELELFLRAQFGGMAPDPVWDQEVRDMLRLLRIAVATRDKYPTPWAQGKVDGLVIALKIMAVRYQFRPGYQGEWIAFEIRDEG